MKAPINLRSTLLALFALCILVQFGCCPTPQKDCCPGKAGDRCPDLVDKLENLAQANELNFTLAEDEKGCPIAKNELVVRIREWCDWPFTAPLDTIIKDIGWDSVLIKIRENPCFIIRISSKIEDTTIISEVDTTITTFKDTMLNLENAIAIDRMCPCDSTLIVLDSTKLSTQEGEAVAKSSGGPQGNGILMLPDFIEDFNTGKFRHIGDYHASERTRKIAVIDSGIDEGLVASRSKQYPHVCNVRSPDDFPRDDLGHGTVVTSIIDQASRRDEEISDHQFLIYKAFDKNGVGTVFDVVCALGGAKYHGADLINMSWGTSVDNWYIKEAIESINKNTPLIASKGNDCLKNIDTVPINYPSDYPNVYDVAALDSCLGTISNQGWVNFYDPYVSSNPGNEQYWKCSNWRDDTLQLMGPGVIEFERDNDNTLHYGTSYSAPFVTGIMARHYYENDGNYPIYTRSEIHRFAKKRVATPFDNISRIIWIPPKQ